MGFEVINTLKKEKGLTNAQLADMSGVTLSTIDKITSGVNTNPKLDTLLSICKVLGCSLNDFVDNSGQNEKTPNMTIAMLGESNNYVSIEESTRLLVALGLIDKGQQLTDDDLAFMGHVLGMLDTWFSSKRH